MKKNASNNRAGQTAGKPFAGARWYALCLVIISVAVYANTLYNGYVLDDMAVITHNKYVANGIAGIPDILSAPSLSGFSERPVYDTAAINDIYRPLSLVMFATEQQLFGNRPIAGHMMNIALFACCVLFLFFFIDRVFQRKKTIFAFIAALLFAVHPIHTEVVANIKSRDELLCFFFAFGALLSFHKYILRGSTTLLLAGAGCYFLSLLSKETSISFLAIIPVVFFFYTPANRKQSMLIIFSTVIAAAAYLSIRFHILTAHNANHPQLMDFMENPLSGAPSIPSRIATALLVMGHYIRLLFVPYPLCSDYTFASIPFADFSNAGVWVAVAVYVALGIIGIYRLATKQRDTYALAILFFLLSIALFSNIVFLTGAIMAERFLFFASAGFCIGLGSVLCDLSDRFSARSLWIMAAAIAVPFAVMTINRNAEWKDNYTLAHADVQKYPRNARLWHSLGYEWATTKAAEASNDADKKEALREGIDCMRKSLSIYPGQFKVHTDIGNIFAQNGRFDSARQHMLQALALKPEDPVIMCELGGIYFAQQQYPKTLELCRRALQKTRGDAAVMNNMALCFLQMALYDSAAYYSQKVLEKDPANSLAGNTLALAKKQMGK